MEAKKNSMLNLLKKKEFGFLIYGQLIVKKWESKRKMYQDKMHKFL